MLLTIHYIRDVQMIEATHRKYTRRGTKIQEQSAVIVTLGVHEASTSR